jgi:hypothetical protein
LVTVHAEEGPVGFVDVTTFPAPSTATHRADVGQEIPDRSFVPST